MTRNELAIKSICKYWIGHKLRAFLSQWREETNRLEVLRYHLQEGPTAVEVHKYRQTLNALKTLCLEEGMSPQKVHKMIKRCDERYSEGIMRVISRMLCSGSKDLRIIPSCFDRWRLWIKYRKAMGYRLRFCNAFVSPRRHALFSAFRAWKTLDPSYKSQLSSLR